MSDIESSSDSASSSDRPWSFCYDKSIYEEGPAIQTLPNSTTTVLQWLALNFSMFVAHPAISKAAFTHNIQVQKVTHGDVTNTLPSSYYEARKLLDPYVVKKVVFDVCVNECVIFRNSGTLQCADMLQCPVCGENRYNTNSSSKTKRPVSRRRFTYIPIGPRLARLYGEVNLAQLVMSHPGSDYDGDEMWDVHHSASWKELYSENGYFGGDKMGISFALELDGVNPFHNIGAIYSMTPIMLTILNFPRHIRNAFGNINLVGIIPGKEKSESSNVSPYMEILVDELIFLTQTKAYSAYANAPVDVKLKLLLYVLDYPGLSKLFNQHGSGSLLGCHWCYVRGEYNKHLSKVVYFSNRSYLEKEDPLRLDETMFASKSGDISERPKKRVFVKEHSYREAYENAKNKTQAQLVASATGCKQSYSVCKLPGHDRVNESLPDCCHTVKDVIQNIMKVVTGNYVDINKIVSAEKVMGRLHTLQRSSSLDTTVLADGQAKSKKPRLGKSQSNESTLPFMLTKDELSEADRRANSIHVPIDFGLKPSPFISKPGSLKSHDWKQIATQGILKFCLKNTLSERCRKTLFIVLDSLTNLCHEHVSVEDIDQIEVDLNRALALLERDFPLSLANITTHILHHIPDGIRRYGPVYGTWMYVFERFNSWICKRALNMRYPESTVIETFIIHDWCNFMVSSGRIPNVTNAVATDTVIQEDEGNNLENSSVKVSKSNGADKRRLIHLRNRDLRSIHKQLEGPSCDSCEINKYLYHTEIHPVTKRGTVFTSKLYEKETAKTVSSFVCSEFVRGAPGQKLDIGTFLEFGRICYFVEHVSESHLETEKNCFAFVEWFDSVQFDNDTHLWFTDLNCGDKRKCSYIKVNKLSKPLVTAEETTPKHLLWFLNSGKIPVV